MNQSLLEHDLKKQLEQTHAVLRILLFGLPTTEAIYESVNSAWMNAYLEDKGWDEKSETLGKFKDKLSRLPWTENIENVVSFTPARFFCAWLSEIDETLSENFLNPDINWSILYPIP